MILTRMAGTGPEQNARLAAALEHSAETLEICTFEYRIYDGKNRLRWMRQSLIPRRSFDGATIFTGAVRDVTREKEAEDQVELMRSAIIIRRPQCLNGLAHQTVGGSAEQFRELRINIENLAAAFRF